MLMKVCWNSRARSASDNDQISANVRCSQTQIKSSRDGYIIRASVGERSRATKKIISIQSNWESASGETRIAIGKN